MRKSASFSVVRVVVLWIAILGAAIQGSEGAVLSAQVGQQVRSQAGQGVAFVGASVVPMSGDGILANHTVLVRGDRILAVGPSSGVDVPADFRRVDAAGKFLIPGLTDMHVHLGARSDLAANLRYGVTSVMQMSGQRGRVSDFVALRDEIERGDVAGPRLFLTGPMFDRPGLGSQTTAYDYPGEEAVPTMLEEHIAAGYDFIKVHNMTPAGVYNQVTRSELPVVGHLPMSMNVDEVLSSGQVMIAHGGSFYYALFYDFSCEDGFWACAPRIRPDWTVLDDAVERIAASGIAVTANLAYLAAEEQVYADFDALLADPEFDLLHPSMQSRWRREVGNRSHVEERKQDLANRAAFERELIARLNRRGVPLLAGSDAPVEGLFPGRALHLDVHEMVEAGVPPIDALRAATATPGRFFDAHVPRSALLGQVREGFAADLLLLDANPLDDIGNTLRIAGTMSHGIWYPLAELDRARGNATH